MHGNTFVSNVRRLLTYTGVLLVKELCGSRSLCTAFLSTRLRRLLCYCNPACTPKASQIPPITICYLPRAPMSSQIAQEASVPAAYLIYFSALSYLVRVENNKMCRGFSGFLPKRVIISASQTLQTVLKLWDPTRQECDQPALNPMELLLHAVVCNNLRHGPRILDPAKQRLGRTRSRDVALEPFTGSLQTQSQ